VDAVVVEKRMAELYGRLKDLQRQIGDQPTLWVTGRY